MKRKHKGIKVLIVFLIIMISVCTFLYAQLNWIQITDFDIRDVKIPNAFEGYKIVQLSDLHSKEFGKDNQRLIQKVDKLSPDVIFVTGDASNSVGDNGRVFLSLAGNLVKKYPVYYILGNHEQISQVIGKRKGNNWVKGFLEELDRLGVHIIDDQKTELVREGQKIGLYGLDIPLMYYRAHDVPYGKDETLFTAESVKQILSQPDKNQYNILLAHTPYFFRQYAAWGADLVFAGHVHGGIIRVPFKGGLLSPEQYYWPKYYGGLYNEWGAGLIVNRGLGESPSIPVRIFNRPEITVVTLHSEGK